MLCYFYMYVCTYSHTHTHAHSVICTHTNTRTSRCLHQEICIKLASIFAATPSFSVSFSKEPLTRFI